MYSSANLGLHRLHISDRVGLYRDDGLGAFHETPQQVEWIKKEICKVFAHNKLKITIEANKKIVNFLVVTLNSDTATTYRHSRMRANGTVLSLVN